MIRARRLVTASLTATLAVALSVAGASAAQAHPQGGSPGDLSPRTHFTMAADGSSGLTQGGEGIPNIDIVKKTIATYYGDPGTGKANMQHSPYISEMTKITSQLTAKLTSYYKASLRTGKTPAIVVDTDDTMLMTYDMEVGDMHFVFTPAAQEPWVQEERFPATPGMVDLVNTARKIGFDVIGITGRSAGQKPASIANVAKVGYTGFTPANYYTKWAAGEQPSYITCATASCTTVEFKAGTRKHLEQDLGYDIAVNIGDQWSDLQGGFADHDVKLPNPTYYLPSPDLPGLNEPKLTPRTQFQLKADGSSGLTQGGEGIPNIDVVKKTIATYYGDTGNGLSNKTASPYISEMTALLNRRVPAIATECARLSAKGENPAIVLDADDTTLWTYDMEVAAMHFVFSPTVQNDDWVQPMAFPATPGMVDATNTIRDAGCTLIGLTGRGANQKTATLGNLGKYYTGFTADNYYTKWAAGQQPSYITCATEKCTTIEYKSQTRAHLTTPAGGDFTLVANFGDQFSDLIGTRTDHTVKLPNPTYYLP